MLQPAAMERLPRPVAGDVGMSAARVREAAAVTLLLLPLAAFLPGIDHRVPLLVAVLLVSVGWGFSIGTWMSRRRAAAAAQEERRRVVRDLHDGAQQRLVHTIITLKITRDGLCAESGQARTLVGEALEQAQAALWELRELANQASPPVLSRGGLEAAVHGLAERTLVPTSVDVSVGRLPPTVEAAAYFVIAEALTNVAKHARARTASVTAWLDAGVLRMEIRDDGVGGADPCGNGLAGLRERVAELDGGLEVSSSADGTRLTAAIPLVR